MSAIASTTVFKYFDTNNNIQLDAHTQNATYLYKLTIPLLYFLLHVCIIILPVHKKFHVANSGVHLANCIASELLSAGSTSCLSRATHKMISIHSMKINHSSHNNYGE